MKKKSERGSILLPMLVSLMIVCGSIAYYYNKMAELRAKDFHKLVTTYGLMVYINSVQSHLLSQVSLIRTFKSALNGDLWSCVNDSEYLCNHSAPVDLNIVKESGDGTELFVKAGANQGLTSGLEACDTYPSAACPFQYRLQWSIQCIDLSTSCHSPDIYVNGQLSVYKDSEYSILNPETFKFSYRIK